MSTIGTARSVIPSTPAAWIISLALLAVGTLFVADHLCDPAKYQIRMVEVRGGTERVDHAQVGAVARDAISGNFFTLSLSEVEARVAELPWVFNASVRRRWPAALVVNVVEVRPVARWGKARWLNFTGDLVARESDTGAVAELANLPLLSAADHHKEEVWQAFQRWSGRFAEHGLSLEQARLDPRGLWRLSLRSNSTAASTSSARAQIPLIVPRQDAEVRIGRFLQALRHYLAAEVAAMRSVDLRYPNGFAIGWKKPPATLAGSH